MRYFLSFQLIMKIRKNCSLLFSLFIIFYIAFLTGLGSVLELNSISTLVITPLLFVFCLLKYGFLKAIAKIEMRALLALFLLGLISSFFSLDVDLTLEVLKKCLGVLLSAFVIVELNSRYRLFKSFVVGMSIGLLSLFLDMLLKGQLKISNILTNVDRNQFLLNANAYNYLSFFVLTGLMIHYIRYRNKIFIAFIVLMSTICTAVVFVTASRGGLLINGMLIFFFILITFKSKNKFLNGCIRFLPLVLFFLVYTQYYQDSYLAQRSDPSSKVHDDSRSTLIQEAFELSLDSPVFGIGPGQSVLYLSGDHFSHNSYMEILLTQGVGSFLLLLILFFAPLFRLLKFKLDAEKLIMTLFFCLFLVYNNFYPFYLSINFMVFFFLMVSEGYKLNENV
jgi:O-antigen ligase